MLFLLAAMTYINTMEERGVFNALRAWLVNRGFTLRTVFWTTGVLSFVMSPIADNLTTALVMSSVVMAVAGHHKQFVAVCCINIVVAANAGGVFSPFGDITTLMVWQKGIVPFHQFFHLLLPSVVNWLIPAYFLSRAVPKGKPDPVRERAVLKHGAWVVVGMFVMTITITVLFHALYHLPPVLGMMTGFGLLALYGHYLRRRETGGTERWRLLEHTLMELELLKDVKPKSRPFNIFISMKRAEWDTLMFFYGVVLCVGGLGAMGYLALLSNFAYADTPTYANIAVGFASAIVDNIPVMVAVLDMNPTMSLGEWLLVTLAAGAGGSLLSIGSAAGVAVMGQARGTYTFLAHLKWSWAILLGYLASIALHLWLNMDLFFRSVGGP